MDRFLSGVPTPIDAYTDGACPNNGKRFAVGGVGVVFPQYSTFNISERLIDPNPTNNRAELFAILRAIDIVNTSIDPKGRRPVHVYTDSMLCVNTFTKWIAGWKKNGWRKRDKTDVLNVDLIKAIDLRMQSRPVMFVHVRAHTGRTDDRSRYNSLADELAVRGAGDPPLSVHHPPRQEAPLSL